MIRIEDALDLGAVPNASTISSFGLEWISDGGEIGSTGKR